MFSSILAWLTRPRCYQCGCGKSYRSEESLGRCVWRHALEVPK